MELDLNTRKNLAKENIEKVKINLQEQGYHIQLPDKIVKNVIAYRQ